MRSKCSRCSLVQTLHNTAQLVRPLDKVFYQSLEQPYGRVRRFNVPNSLNLLQNRSLHLCWANGTIASRLPALAFGLPLALP
jgi:hypothetical protein